MKAERTLKDMATLFLALGDGTRLRVLNLMRHGEICVSAFTDVLSQSQPKVSRHLAYLRNAGIVEARRDGKWMHYSLAAGLDDKTRLLLHELFKWMADQDALQRDTERYAETGHQTHFQAFLPLVPEPALTAVHSPKPRRQRTVARQLAVTQAAQLEDDLYDESTGVEEDPFVEELPVVDDSYEDPMELEDDPYEELAEDQYSAPRHNELEDFLL